MAKTAKQKNKQTKKKSHRWRMIFLSMLVHSWLFVLCPDLSYALDSFLLGLFVLRANAALQKINSNEREAETASNTLFLGELGAVECLGDGSQEKLPHPHLDISDLGIILQQQ